MPVPIAFYILANVMFFKYLETCRSAIDWYAWHIGVVE